MTDGSGAPIAALLLFFRRLSFVRQIKKAGDEPAFRILRIELYTGYWTELHSTNFTELNFTELDAALAQNSCLTLGPVRPRPGGLGG